MLGCRAAMSSADSKRPCISRFRWRAGIARLSCSSVSSGISVCARGGRILGSASPQPEPGGAEVQVNLERLVSAFSHAGDHTRVTAVLRGHPALQICNYARQHHCDLIVLATHGRTGLRHLIMGSTAEQVIRHAPRSVLTITLDRAHNWISHAPPRSFWGLPRPTGAAITPA